MPCQTSYNTSRRNLRSFSPRNLPKSSLKYSSRFSWLIVGAFLAGRLVQIFIRLLLWYVEFARRILRRPFRSILVRHSSSKFSSYSLSEISSHPSSDFFSEFCFPSSSGCSSNSSLDSSSNFSLHCSLDSSSDFSSHSFSNSSSNFLSNCGRALCVQFFK